MKRRTFLHRSGLLSLATISSSSILTPNKLIDKIGLGLFSIPKKLDADIDSAFAMLQTMGYREVELYGPYEFSTEKEKQKWAAITPQLGFTGSGFYGRTVDEMADVAKTHGLSIPSMHTDLDTLTNNIGPLLETANKIGARYIVLPAIPEEFRKTPDDYKRVAEIFNKIGADASRQDIRFAYHNHGYGLQVKDGRMPIDTIFESTDPKLVFFEMDLYWTIAGGADPQHLFSKHKGRYKMVHIKDMKEKRRFEGDGGDPSQWISLFPYMTSAGSGIFDLPKILRSAKLNGVDHFFVEQDMVADPEISLKKSIDYLKAL